MRECGGEAGTPEAAEHPTKPGTTKMCFSLGLRLGTSNLQSGASGHPPLAMSHLRGKQLSTANRWANCGAFGVGNLNLPTQHYQRRPMLALMSNAWDSDCGM